MVDTMITLHESTEMSFTTNGLGALSDAITCEVTEERNGEFELEMEYPVTGKRYKEKKLRRKNNPDIRNYSLGLSLWQSQILILTHNHSESMQSQSQLMELLQ